MSKPFAAMLALTLLSACTQVETFPTATGYRIEYGDRYAEKTHADSVRSSQARDKCPSGWEVMKDYQVKGDGHPIWVWEIECLK